MSISSQAGWQGRGHRRSDCRRSTEGNPEGSREGLSQGCRALPAAW